VAAIWSIALAIEVYLVSLVLGVLMQLPQGSLAVLLHGSVILAITVLLTIVSTTPFAFLASLGRGYLLPLGFAVLVAILANLIASPVGVSTFPGR